MKPTIRIATTADAAAFAELYAPYVHGQITSFELEAPDAAEMARRVDDTLPRWPWLTAERDGVVLGYAYACEHRKRAAYQWSVDVAVYLHAAARRQGIGRALYSELFAILRRQGYVNAYAGIALPNVASVGLHETLGFRPVGIYEKVGFKLGAPRDVGWWQLALQAWPAAPTAPVAFAELKR